MEADDNIYQILYTNLLRMLTYRDYTLTDPPMDTNAIMRKINQMEGFQIRGRRGEGIPEYRTTSTIIVIVIAENSSQAHKVSDFRKLIPQIPADNCELMFVSRDVLTNHIIKHIDTILVANPRLVVESYTYETFTFCPMDHVLVPRHEIMTKEEITALCQRYHLAKSSLQKILQTDVVAVWLGVKPGMVVKIYRNSETSGWSMGYRYCVAK
jgi:DNA-directed RNA polymerase subunit H (RpoH/RPB5)